MNTVALAPTLVFAFGFGIVCGVAACVDEPPHHPVSTLSHAAPGATCPLGVPGATATPEDVDGGIALVFRAPAEGVNELRARAHDAAAVHGPGAGVGKGHAGRHGTGGEHGLKAMQLPPSSIVPDDTNDGTRLVFRPSDPRDLELLRSKVRERAGAMMSSCD